MFDILLDVLAEALIDSLKMLPFLFGVYLLIEFLEHKSSGKMVRTLQKLGPFGAVGGALLGCVPQCGFSVAAANLYSGRMISAGTLIAVFISTSDEAVPIILGNPQNAKTAIKLLAVKVAIAIVVGIICDLVLKALNKPVLEKPCEQLCEHCGCENHGILYSAVKHTVSIFLFILAISVVLGGLIEIIGQENLSKLLLTDSVFQPFLAALIGFIPNCAASVILTQLFIEGGLTFGSLVAGLSTGAGLGLVVLFKTNKHFKQNISIAAVLYIAGALSGMLINMIFY